MKRELDIHRPNTTSHSAHAAVDPEVEREVDPAVGPRVGAIQAARRLIPHPGGVCGDRSLPTYLRHPEVGA
jgi:hypothetical protein